MSRQESFPPRRTDAAAPADMGAGGGAKRPLRQPPWEKEAGSAEAGSFGDWLRRQREMREITLRDIADRTKISLRYLEAMEADRFDLLPAPIFAKGFLREYARYVGLSPDDVVNHYLSVHHPEELPADPKEDTKVRSRPKPVDPGQPPVRRSWSYGLVLAVAGLVLLVLVAVAAYLADRRREEPSKAAQAPPIAAPPPAPIVQPTPAPVAPAVKAPLEVSLDFTKECWVEALIDGKNRLAETRWQGEALQLEAEKSIVLTLGNVGAVDVQVNGYPLELGGREGDVVHDLLVDLNTVQALKEKKEAR
ncbi:MAG TPA: helix-turn-helix domain-containing protein [Thermoanaerobaculia bacterium]|nr:helix-turn-helix domain-containing protein [Thermoanaerobaculia bacterium]